MARRTSIPAPSAAASKAEILEHAIEVALMPGSFIDWRAKDHFLDGVHAAEEEVDKLALTEPAEAAALYEAFLAGLMAKMEEFDDDGDMGPIANRLFVAWINARRASGAPPRATIEKLVWWIEHDDYGLAYEIERGDVVGALDKAALDILGQTAREKLAGATQIAEERERRSFENTWRPILRAVLVAQRNVAEFVAAADRDGLTPGDCQTIAEILASEGKRTEALAWVEKGLALKSEKRSFGISDDLGALQRRLLLELGRTGDALASAWAAFVDGPWEHRYDDLMALVPDAERAAWHEKAMVVTDKALFSPVSALLVKCGETARLAARVRAMSDAELEHLGHFTAEPVAAGLEAEHPHLAARLYAATGLRVVNRGKSRYYTDALINFGKARDCFQRAGRSDDWSKLVSQIRSDHSRKSGFMPAFEGVVAGALKAKEPSFLERARRKHGPPG